jgi:hypothetical protein
MPVRSHGLDSQLRMSWSLSMLKYFRCEVIGCFVDICGIVDHHCLNMFLIIYWWLFTVQRQQNYMYSRGMQQNIKNICRNEEGMEHSWQWLWLSLVRFERWIVAQHLAFFPATMRLLFSNVQNKYLTRRKHDTLQAHYLLTPYPPPGIALWVEPYELFSVPNRHQQRTPFCILSLTIRHVFYTFRCFCEYNLLRRRSFYVKDYSLLNSNSLLRVVVKDSLNVYELSSIYDWVWVMVSMDQHTARPNIPLGGIYRMFSRLDGVLLYYGHPFLRPYLVTCLECDHAPCTLKIFL